MAGGIWWSTNLSLSSTLSQFYSEKEFRAGRDSALALNQIIIRDGLFEIPVCVIMIKKGYKKPTSKLSILARISSTPEL